VGQPDCDEVAARFGQTAFANDGKNAYENSFDAAQDKSQPADVTSEGGSAKLIGVVVC
jgi:hypothetical protein